MSYLYHTFFGTGNWQMMTAFEKEFLLVKVGDGGLEPPTSRM